MIRMLLSVSATFALFLAPALSASEIVSARVIRPSTPIACSKTSGLGALSSPDTLVQIALLYPTGWNTIAFGDTDHDERNEAVFYWRDPNWEWHYVILEEQGSNVYSQEYVGPQLIPWAIGDLDQDGKAEIIGQVGYYVHVYESADATSYPSQLVWSSPALSNVEGFTTIGDTDRDGKMEIIHSVNFGSFLYIFENSGDNGYTLAFSTHTGSQDDGEKVIADLDGDGLVEIAFCGHRGQLHVYESPADNTWVETFSDTTELRNANGAEGGVDTDGNGIPELFIAGDRSADYQKTTLVYEANGDNQFAVVATLLLLGDNSAGGATNAIGDLDGAGLAEYVFVGAFGLFVYAASGPGTWELQSETLDPTPSGYYNGVQTFDVNKNGRQEVFWDSFGPPIMVLERPPRTSDSGPLDTARLEPLRVLPNPLRGRGIVVAPLSAQDAERLTVYDAKGRLVESLGVAKTGSRAWDPSRLSAGVYYVQLENRHGLPLARGRATILR